MSGFLSAGIVGGPDIPDSVVAQWDARDLSFSDGDAVTDWGASVGSFTASGSGTFRSAGINGHPSVDMDGTDDGFDHGFEPSQPSVLFVVIEPDFTDSTTTNHKISAWSASAGGTAHSVAYESGDWVLYNGSAITGTTTASRQLITVRFDGSNSYLREDGTETTSGDTGSETPESDGTFGYDFDEGYHFDGDIGFLEWHDGTPSNGLTTREQEIADMWGITL